MMNRPAPRSIRKLQSRWGSTSGALPSGIFAIVETKMAGAIREITVEKGFDPRDFALLAFGGSGPFFACNLARKCEIGKVVIPVAPANFSAMGMLLSDLLHHYSRTMILELKAATAGQIDSIFGELESLGRSALDSDGIPAERREFHRSLDGAATSDKVAIP